MAARLRTRPRQTDITGIRKAQRAVLNGNVGINRHLDQETAPLQVHATNALLDRWNYRRDHGARLSGLALKQSSKKMGSQPPPRKARWRISGVAIRTSCCQAIHSSVGTVSRTPHRRQQEPYIGQQAD
jgi:hypothetical protein